MNNNSKLSRTTNKDNKMSQALAAATSTNKIKSDKGGNKNIVQQDHQRNLSATSPDQNNSEKFENKYLINQMVANAGGASGAQETQNNKTQEEMRCQSDDQREQSQNEGKPTDKSKKK